MEFGGEEIDYSFVIQKAFVLLFCVALSWKMIIYMCNLLNIEKDPIRVLITGAAGKKVNQILDFTSLFVDNPVYILISDYIDLLTETKQNVIWFGNIGYAIAPMIARGIMLGPDQPMILHLLDIEPASSSLQAVKMELQDSAFPLLKGVIATTNVVEACKDVNIAIMIGGFPRKAGMERKDVMSKNVVIYKAQASALEHYASEDCKVLVVANPANTNALILKEFAPSIPEENITCLTRLDHNRALAELADKLSVPVSSVKNVIIWGNHSSTQYPDTNHAKVSTKNKDRPVKELVTDHNWLKNEFIVDVQQRGAAILRARKQSSALSAASAACDHIHDWFLGTPKGNWVSMGVCSDGSYGIATGLVYSFPVTCEKGSWKIVQGLSIDEFSREKMDESARELAEEKALAYSCLNV